MIRVSLKTSWNWLLGMAARHPVRSLAIFFLIVSSYTIGRAWQRHARIDLVDVLPGVSLEFPVMFLSKPFDERSFIVEKKGFVKWFMEGRKELGGVFLDLSNSIASEGPEDGLLSLAFPPEVASHKFFYAFLTLANPPRSQVVRFPIPEHGPVDEQAGETILEVAKTGEGHNGGMLLFGPDGMLYVTIGDGLMSILRPRVEHDAVLVSRATLLGTVLRINPMVADGSRPYSIPPDNPFVSEPGVVHPEIYAYGLRNPWRFSFDGEGRMFLCDVGAGKWEEVNMVRPGRNYGWPIAEGEWCHHSSDHESCDKSGGEMPIGSFRHGSVMNAITSVFLYQGQALPWLRDQLVVSSFERGIYAMAVPNDGVVNRPLVLFSDRSWNDEGHTQSLRIASMSVGHDGELYAVNFDGSLLKLVKRGFHSQMHDFLMGLLRFG